MEQRTENRLSKLQTLLGSIASLVKARVSPPSLSPPVLGVPDPDLGPEVSVDDSPSQVVDPVKSNPRPVFTFSPDQRKPLPPKLPLDLYKLPPPQDPVLEASSRTLGFYPFNTGNPNNGPSSPPSPKVLESNLRYFLIHSLHIPNSIADLITINRLFEHEYPAGIYVEFSDANDVNNIFKYIRNLPSDYTIHRYIHPSLKARFDVLSEKAFNLRNSYDKLGLSCAKLSSSWDWTLIKFNIHLVSLNLIW